MLSKTNRLQKEKDIERVFKEGRGFKEDFLILKTAKNNLDKIRFWFIVSTKISLKATIRNRIRRRLSELVRIKLKNLKSGSDNILIASPGLESKDFWEMEESLNELFLKAKIIKWSSVVDEAKASSSPSPACSGLGKWLKKLFFK